MRPFFRHEHPIAMAHRGSRLLWPENTMPAFEGAVQLGYRYLETDLHATNDEVLVCLHDDTLDRTTDGSGKVWAHSWAELQRLDAGFRFAGDGDFPFRGRGVTIPSFEELVTTYPQTMITVDLKQSGIEGLLAEAVARFELWDRIIAGSFRDGRLRRFRHLTGRRVATSSGPQETLRMWLAARRGRGTPIPADALQVPVRYGPLTLVDERTVAAAHAAEKQVHVWTVNEPGEMRRLLDLGVDGLITDRPDLLRDLMLQRGRGGPWHG